MVRYHCLLNACLGFLSPVEPALRENPLTNKVLEHKESDGAEPQRALLSSAKRSAEIVVENLLGTHTSTVR